VTDPVFLTDLPPRPQIGDLIGLDGDEGRHAVVVRRLHPGESVVLSDGAGRGVAGPIVAVTGKTLTIRVERALSVPEPPIRWVVAQALAKGGHDESAIDQLTQAGVAEVIPWQADRCIVRWAGERAVKGTEKWRRTVREAAKQSRRLRVPEVSDVIGTAALAERVRAADAALLLHEEAAVSLAACSLPTVGTVLLIVGPEGGITPAETTTLTEAGATPVLVSDGVLRSSTAGIVGLAQAQGLVARG